MSLTFPKPCHAGTSQNHLSHLYKPEQEDIVQPQPKAACRNRLDSLLTGPTQDEFIPCKSTKNSGKPKRLSANKQQTKRNQEKLWKILEVSSQLRTEGELSLFFPQLLATVAAGADINALNEENTTPLLWAASHGYTSVVRDLAVIPGLDVNKTDIGSQSPALLLAAKAGQLETVKALLEIQGINVNQADIQGNTALQVAASLGYNRIVEALLSCQKLKINQTDLLGMSALQQAHKQGQKQTVELLKSYGASI